MQKIRNAHPRLSLGQVIEELAYDVSAVKPSPQSQHAASAPAPKPQPVQTPRRRPSRGTITRDDITNLQIELAMCDDMQQFIDKM